MLATKLSIQHSRKLHSDGTCVAVWLHAASTAFGWFMCVIANILCDVEQISGLEILGAVFGKESSRTKAADARAILPLPPLMQILDAYLESLVCRMCDDLFDWCPGFM